MPRLPRLFRQLQSALLLGSLLLGAAIAHAQGPNQILLDEASERTQLLRSRLVAGLSDLQFVTLLSAETLADPARRAGGERRMKAFEAVVIEFDRARENNVRHLRERASELLKSPEERASFLTGMMEGMEKASPVQAAQSAIYRDLVAITRATYAYFDGLEKAPLHQDGKVVFANQRDLDGFNTLMAQVQTVIERDKQNTERGNALMKEVAENARKQGLTIAEPR